MERSNLFCSSPEPTTERVDILTFLLLFPPRDISIASLLTFKRGILLEAFLTFFDVTGQNQHLVCDQNSFMFKQFIPPKTSSISGKEAFVCAECSLLRLSQGF